MPGQEGERPRRLYHFLDDAWRTVVEITPAQVQERMDRGEVDLILDVRESDEWAQGHIPGALHAPRGLLEWYADPGSDATKPELTAQREGRIVVYCGSGGRSLLASQMLQRMGYADVVSMGGGFADWAAAGFPIS